MNNFNLMTDVERFTVDTFLVTRASSSYEFFHSEFISLPYDNKGNILMSYPTEKVPEKGIKKVLNSIKNRLQGNEDKSIGIPVGTEGYYFFNSEYSQLSRDAKQNIIVPEDIYTKIKRK